MKRISRLSEVKAPFAAVICDLWGVLHDGRRLFVDAVAALREVREAGKAVAVLSNSPRPARHSLERLRSLGAGEGWFDALITSGDLTRAFLETRPAAALFHIGQARDAVTLDGLPNPAARSPEEAELLVCTGFSDALGLDLDAHAAFLQEALAAGRTLVCANPDKVVPIGSSQVYCAGAIAERYEAEGGQVVWLGKPEAAAYQACLEEFGKKLGRPVSVSEVLAIGDNLETDIKGAARLGMTSVFISEGLHGHFTEPELEALTERLGIKPDFVMARLQG